MGIKSSNVGIGNALEQIIEMSAQASGGLVALSHLPQSGAKFHGQSRAHPLPIDCDFHGTIRGGRGIFFDAKSDESPTRLELGKTKVKPHQRAFLVRMGRNGAVAGLIAESSHHGVLFWVPWQILDDDSAKSVRWTDERLIRLGWRCFTFSFKGLIGNTEVQHAGAEQMQG